uniref:Uncharacterized protein n=1 Tax=Sphaeramia orbicularis TaxID=375764 RepID=A0A672Z323_9TELE
MKLGLLVVLAIAILVPNLSESHTVTRCELKTQLDAAIKLPRVSTRLKQKYLALGEVDNYVMSTKSEQNGTTSKISFFFFLFLCDKESYVSFGLELKDFKYTQSKGKHRLH